MRSARHLRLPAAVLGLAALAAGLLASPASSRAATRADAARPIYLDPAYSPPERAADLVARMTTQEKAAQMDSSRAPAIPRLGVAAWGWWNESNHGVNASTLTPTGNATILVNTTSYPSDLSMGSTWNPALVYREARQIGAEAREVSPGNTENLDFYAPTVNLSRDPRWGRNDETWSEDPTLTADLASRYVDGLRSENSRGQLPKSANGYYQAIATLKHFAANNTENTRLTDASTGTEARDRTTLALPGAQASMIQQLEAANPDTVVYLETMGEVDTSPFQASTPALLWSSYNGQRQGAALADVLLGKAGPSGHLPFTWYADPGQIPPTTDYGIRPAAGTDGRTYQYFTGSVSWPFGYGLSYADFSYSALATDRSHAGANGTVTASADVTNTGRVPGATVAQLYVTTPDAPAAAQRPVRRLVAFQKVFLVPGQTRHLTFRVSVPGLAFFSEAANRYQVDDGRYGLQLGTSSTDIAGQAFIDVTGALRPVPSVVTVQPVMPGDPAAGVAQRVFFPAGAAIVPQVTVSLSDQSRFGYITRGQSTPLPPGMTVRYSSDNPGVVRVSPDGSALRAAGPGPATITATVSYRGRTAAGSVVVDVP